MASIAPLSVQMEERIVLDKRERKTSLVKEVRDAEKIVSKLDQAAQLQNSLGLGNPRQAVEQKKADYGKLKVLAQAEKLAEKFTSIKEPSQKFFPRFKREGAQRSGTAFAEVTGRLPELVMVKLGPGVERLHCRLRNVTSLNDRDHEAPLPVMPLTALELASRAKECAPDAEFHLLFLPSWEPVPQKDPVLVAHLPGTDEWFQIAEWDGDKDLIKEFLEDR